VAQISGDGHRAWAATTTNRLLAIDIGWETTEVLPPLGRPLSHLEGSGVPGSYESIAGEGFTSDQTVLLDGEPVPVLYSADERLTIQIPWEYIWQPRNPELVIHRDGNSFEAVGSAYVANQIRPAFARQGEPPLITNLLKAAHQDFRGVATIEDAAERGETVHLYLGGLGPVDRAVATGALAPSDPPARPLIPFACYVAGAGMSFRGATVPFLALAPGLIGVYQADITLPRDLAPGLVRIRCEANGLIDEGMIPVR
jgi:uncharacterized protein (TIGR03437 family)